MPFWLADEPLVLASKSTIRHAILRDAGIPVAVEPADIDERAIEQRSAKEDAGELAAVLACEKARTVAARSIYVRYVRAARVRASMPIATAGG